MKFEVDHKCGENETGNQSKVHDEKKQCCEATMVPHSYMFLIANNGRGPRCWRTEARLTLLALRVGTQRAASLQQSAIFRSDESSGAFNVVDCGWALLGSRAFIGSLKGWVREFRHETGSVESFLFSAQYSDLSIKL